MNSAAPKGWWVIGLTRGIPIVILIVSTVNIILIGGKQRTIGILVSALHANFNSSMSSLNWIADSYCAVSQFLVPFSSTIILYFDKQYKRSILFAGGLILIACISSASVPRPSFLYLTHTLFHGIGSAFVTAVCILIVGDYFQQKHRFHVLTTTLVSDGPFGVLLLGPLYAYLVGEYNWRVAFVILGLILFAGAIVGSLTLVRSELSEYEEIDSDQAVCEESHLHPAHRIHWQFCSFAHIHENLQIFPWLAERMLQSIVSTSLMINLTDYATESSKGKIEQGARMNLLYGFGESVIFIIVAMFGDKMKGYLSFCYLMGSFLSTIILILFQFEYIYVTTIMALTFFLGLSMGMGNTAVYAVSEEVMNVRGPIGYSTSSLMTGIGIIISTFFSGYVIDAFGYGGYFCCQAILMTLRLILLILINYLLQERAKQEKNKPAEIRKPPSLTIPKEEPKEIVANNIVDYEESPINQQTNF